MGALALKMPFGKNEGLIMSPSELKEIYLFGIGTSTKDGREIPAETYTMYLKASQREIETYLNIKLTKQIVEENKDFLRDDFRCWNFIRCSFPVNKAYVVEGTLNGIRQINYPKEWLCTKKSTQKDQMYRQIYLVPNAGSANIESVYVGITPHLGLLGTQFIPNYWRVVYCTGYSYGELPDDLINFAGKLASINIFAMMGDLIFGAGIASQSLGIDGLSQSISSTKSANASGYGARIKGYLEDLKNSWPRLKQYYSGIEMMSM